MILVLLLVLLHSNLPSLIMSNAAFLSVIFHRSMKWLELEPLSTSLLVCWYHGTLCLFNTSGLSSTIIWHLPFQSISLLSNCGGKTIIFGDCIEIHLTNQNTSTYLLMSLSLMFQLFEIQYALKLRRRSMVFWKWKCQFFWKSSFSDALLNATTSTKETLDHEFFIYSKIFCPCVGTASNANLTRIKKTTAMELKAWD